MSPSLFKAVALNAGVVGANLFWFFLILLGLADYSVFQVLNLIALVWSGVMLANLYSQYVEDEVQR